MFLYLMEHIFVVCASHKKYNRIVSNLGNTEQGFVWEESTGAANVNQSDIDKCMKNESPGPNKCCWDAIPKKVITD